MALKCGRTRLFAIGIIFLGFSCFILGILSVTVKPWYGIPVPADQKDGKGKKDHKAGGGGGVTLSQPPSQQQHNLVCKYPLSYPYKTVTCLGVSSVVALVMCSVLGLFSVLYPYSSQGVIVPTTALLRRRLLVVFTIVALFGSVRSGYLMVLGTMNAAGVEHNHYQYSYSYGQYSYITIIIRDGVDYDDQYYSSTSDDLLQGCLISKTGLLGSGAFIAFGTSFLWLVCLRLAHDVRESYHQFTLRIRIHT